jgi:hypothetical protein
VLLGRPFPGGDDDIALDAGRPRRFGFRQFALGDPLGPVAEIPERHAAELTREPVHHQFASLARGDAAHPGFLVRFEFAEPARDRARGFLAKLMATDAVDVIHPLAPYVLRDLLRNLRAAAEILRRRNLHHRVPVDRRVIMGRRRLVWCRNRREVELLAGLGPQPGRIHQPVAADPDCVVHVRRQVRDHVAALIVGDDDLGEFGRQLGGLRDHPDASLRPVWSEHHAADIVIVDCDRRDLLRMRWSRREAEYARRRSQGEREQDPSEIHGFSPRNHELVALAQTYTKPGLRREHAARTISSCCQMASVRRSNACAASAFCFSWRPG